MEEKDIIKWLNIIENDIKMIIGNKDNEDNFARMAENALKNISWLKSQIISQR